MVDSTRLAAASIGLATLTPDAPPPYDTSGPSWSPGQVQAAPLASAPFDPARHLSQISNRDYLEVKWRLVWLRSAYPQAVIVTDMIADDGERAVFRAAVTLPPGGSATGWGSETVGDFGDYLEKAETKALGRALAALGFGTQFAGDDHSDGSSQGRPVDSPVDRGQRSRPPGQGASGDLATERQVKAIYGIAQAGKMSREDLERFALEQFGNVPDRLSRRDASALIDWIKCEIGGGA